MSEGNYFQDKNKKFTQDHGRNSSYPSTTLLHACFHPLLTTEDQSFTFIVKLEKITYPSGVDVIELSNNLKYSPIEESKDANMKMSYSLNPVIDEEDEQLLDNR